MFSRAVLVDLLGQSAGGADGGDTELDRRHPVGGVDSEGKLEVGLGHAVEVDRALETGPIPTRFRPVGAKDQPACTRGSTRSAWPRPHRPG